MMKILVERTQKAGDKLIDKSLSFGPEEKFDISNAFRHSKETLAPKYRALFNFMNQACGMYAKKNSHHNFDLHPICGSILSSFVRHIRTTSALTGTLRENAS